MVISAKTGAAGTQLSKTRAAHSLGSSDRQILMHVILPNALPEILTGIRIFDWRVLGDIGSRRNAPRVRPVLASSKMLRGPCQITN